MIRIVADTNVYVSAIVFGSTCEEILALARSGIVEINVSPAIQRELRRVLRTGFQVDRITGPSSPYGSRNPHHFGLSDR